MCCMKSRHDVLESNFSLWFSKSTDHSLEIKIFYVQLQKLHCMRFLLNSGMCFGISFSSDDSNAFRLLVLIKGKDHCRLLYLLTNDFVTTILKWSKEIELPGFLYTTWLSQWQCRWDWKISSNKVWICFYDLVDMQTFFDW